jgi:hypothetical protein
MCQMITAREADVAMDIITPVYAMGYIIHAGYF